ncbi:hypothetical protein C7N43_27205 [Sphingobacteriales bacterium UPWRP_1]|nr:hypothetical protein C7N43_27205 [Sphingobacteriales bacterium UPWRP_1]
MIRLLTHTKLRFENAEQLFQGLKEEDSEAISYLHRKVWGKISQMGKSQMLSNENIEELINDSIVFLLLKIRKGEYLNNGNHPAIYVIKVATYKLMEYKRLQRKHQSVELETNLKDTEDETQKISEVRDRIEELQLLLTQLGQNCANLLRLTHIEGYKDEEIIQQSLTQYSTIATLKNKRSQCMKRLIELATQNSTKSKT